MAEILAKVDVTPWDVVNSLNWNYNEILEFVLKVDETVADLDFTKALRDELNEIISREEDNG